MIYPVAALVFAALPACAWAQSGPTAAAPEVQPLSLTVAEHGIAARFYAPSGTGRAAAVVMLGGSDCGYPSALGARDLAAAGHPVLALAYCSGFSGPIAGVPAQLANIPLEYVDRGFDWLRSHLGRTRPIAVMGESRGAELALLYGSMRPGVAAVIGFSPSGLAWGAVGDATGTIPAWTDRGQPVPRVTAQMAPVIGPEPFLAVLREEAQVRTASIAVERIRGPILLLSSRSDGIWPAAAMADRIETRLSAARFRHQVQNLQFDDASHLLMGPGPGRVRFEQGSFVINFGGTEEGTLAARNRGWAAAKRLLASLAARRR